MRRTFSVETREQQIGRGFLRTDVEDPHPDRKESIEAEVPNDARHRAPPIGMSANGQCATSEPTSLRARGPVHQRIERRVVLACRDLLCPSVQCGVGGEEMLPQLWTR
jgi:hypothetical protein